jgi:hypothetical protein
MYLPRTHIWHVFFHSFHYHLVIWGHLLLVLILFLTLIKSLTIWLLSYALLLPLLNFEINCSETIPWPIPLPLIYSNYPSTCWCTSKPFTHLCNYVLNPNQKFIHPFYFSLTLLVTYQHRPTTMSINPNLPQITLVSVIHAFYNLLFFTNTFIRPSSYSIFLLTKMHGNVNYAILAHFLIK